MARIVLLVVLAILVAFISLSAWLVAKIGWIAVPILVVLVLASIFAGLVLLKRNAGRLVERVLSQPFKMKGAVLRDAEATIHSVLPAGEVPFVPAAPDPDDDTDGVPAADVPKVRWWIDVTIVPAAQCGQTPFGAWEPGELSLAAPDASPDDVDDESGADIVHVEVEEEGTFKRWEGEKYVGPQRLRLLASVPESMREARFRYYFELFGSVQLPAAASQLRA